jgi:hypothetical protein
MAIADQRDMRPGSIVSKAVTMVAVLVKRLKRVVHHA